MSKRTIAGYVLIALLILTATDLFASNLFINKEQRKANRETEMQELQKQFQWWPTDAQPAPIKDADMGGYWWWPKEPGTAASGTTSLWGNRGYIYMYKIIFDYKSEELPAPKPQELRPSLLIKNIKKNVKIYFDYNKSYLRVDVKKILDEAVWTLKHNPDCSILITGNCDIRGTEKYNQKLGRQRADAVKDFMLKNGIPDGRIKIVSRGKLDAIAPVTDLIGMQKDRNAQFMIAEVEEVMIPAPGEAQLEQATKVEEGKYVIEEEKNVESKIKVSKREYVVQKGDTLSSIAKKELGNPAKWKYLYEINKDRISSPNKLRAGTKIIIPKE
ncbi:MAG: OmpA family protein [Candidatus Omnitrophica bacterium]|nr:OmpA family protein [Candidatus Omnitrophota bacterium]MDD5311270.1 OmpA family protein [Candidatus Omnitrophota bacterium]